MKILTKINVLVLFGYQILAVGCSEKPESYDQPSVVKEVWIQLNSEQIAGSGIKSGELPKVRIESHIECVGLVDVPPNQRAMVHALIPTTVEEVKVLPGESVTSGQVLAILTHPNLIDLQEEFLASRIRYRELQTELTRKEELMKSNVTSQREYIKLKAEADRARIQLDAFRKKLKLIGISEKTIEKKGIISRVSVRANITGAVVEVFVSKGDFVEANQPLFRLLDPDHKHLELEVFAKDAHALQVGQTVRYRVPGFPTELEGHVFLINPDVSENNTVRVHAHLTDEDVNWKIGSFVTASIIVEQKLVAAVRNEELILEGDRSYLFKVVEDGYQKVEVGAGVSDQEYTQVIPMRHNENDRFVLSGNYYLNGI